jgi:hypothetical protein
LLAHDVVLTGDGGGKAPALVRSLRGRNRVARTLRNRSKPRLASQACRYDPSRSTAAQECSTSTHSSG